MKVFIYILILISITACTRTEQDALYVEYIEQFTQITERHREENKSILIEYERELIDSIFGAGLLIKPWADRAFKVNNLAESLIQSIEMFKLEICQVDSFQQADFQFVKKRKFSISTENIKQLQVQSEIFKKYTLSLIEDTVRYELLYSALNDHLDIEKWVSQCGMGAYACNSLELVSILCKIQMDIKIAETDALYYLYGQSDTGSGGFFIPRVFIQPYEHEVVLGDEYIATIYFGSHDSTIEPQIYVDNQLLTIKDAKAIYRKKIISRDTGLVVENGYFLMRHPGTGKELKLPFTLEYYIKQD